MCRYFSSQFRFRPVSSDAAHVHHLTDEGSRLEVFSPKMTYIINIQMAHDK